MFLTDHEVSLVASALLAGVAVIVPVQTFRFTRRQDADKGLREKRSDAYIRLLAAASASREDAHVRAGTIRHSGELKIELLTDRESRTLMAQIIAFGSPEVRDLHNSFVRALATVYFELHMEDDLKPSASDSPAHAQDLLESVRRRRQAQVEMDAALRGLEERVSLELRDIGKTGKLIRGLFRTAKRRELTPRADTSN